MTDLFFGQRYVGASKGAAWPTITTFAAGSNSQAREPNFFGTFTLVEIGSQTMPSVSIRVELPRAGRLLTQHADNLF